MKVGDEGQRRKERIKKEGKMRKKEKRIEETRRGKIGRAHV